MRIDILTVFPEMFQGPLDFSIVSRAVRSGIVEIQIHDLRDFTESPQRKTDDTQFGGGSGMLMNALPIIRGVEAVQSIESEAEKTRTIFLSAAGTPLTQELARELSLSEQLILVCGHYKGVDQRAIEYLNGEEISIGDYVLSGGELPAMVLADAIVRLLPGAVGSLDSVEEDSFYEGLLEAPRYTRPQDVRGLGVPEVLLSGDHAAIDEWRLETSLERTRKHRPDLYRKWTEEHGYHQEVDQMQIIHSLGVTATPVSQDASGVTIRQLLAENVGAAKFHMRLFEVQPGGHTPHHEHGWEHEVFILQGSGTIVSEDGEMPFQAGDAIWVSPGEKHQFKNNSSETLRFLCLIPTTGTCT